MTRFTFKNAGLSEKPITRDEYRVIAIVATLSILLMAAIVFAIDHRWQVAAVTAVLSIPGGLFGGVLWCVLRRGCPKPTTWREVAEQGSGPTSRMTATATHQGIKNAMLCAVLVFAVSGFVFWFLNAFTALQWTVALFSAFMIPFAVCLFVMIANWIPGTQLRGELIVDCGPHPGRRLFLINAIFFIALGFSGFAFGGLPPIFMTLFAVYWLFMATGRSSVYSTGLWVYHTLVPWDKISFLLMGTGQYTNSADHRLVFLVSQRHSCSGRTC